MMHVPEERAHTAIQTMLAQEMRRARREGYLAAMAQVETAVYQGEEALFALLASMPRGS